MSQLRAFLLKAWIVKKRHPGALFLEIILPIIFIGLSAVIARFIVRDEIQALPSTIEFASDFPWEGSPCSAAAGPIRFLFSKTPTGVARRPVAVKAPADADAALLKDLLEDMNLRCPPGRFFQLPQSTSIEDYVFQADQDSFFAAIDFSSLSATNVNFTIRMQYGMLTRMHQGTQVPATERVSGLGFNRWFYNLKAILRTGTAFLPCPAILNCPTPIGIGSFPYISSGFIAIQGLIQTSTRRVLARTQAATNISALPDINIMLMATYPHGSGTKTPDYSSVSTYLALSYIAYAFTLSKQMLQEKEARIKEGMLIMGMRPSVFWTGWAVTAVVTSLYVSILVIISGIYVVFAVSPVGLIIVTVGCYTLSVITLVFFVYSVANRSNFGSVGVLVFLVLGIVLYSTVRDSFADPGSMKALGWFTVFPWMRAVELLTAGIDTWHDGGDYTLLQCILWMFGDFFLYMFAAWYTDKVFPGEYGIKYPFYFLFSKNYWCPPAISSHAVSTIDPENAGDGTSGTADGSFEEARDTSAVIQVKNLVKVFRKNPLKESPQDKVAVEGMNFFMREGEIFCLLGHNGAGKTTTINCMTGLLDCSAGDTTIYGRSIRTESLEIRRSIGFCPQHNVLYDDLTVEEHLQLFAKMKGYAGAELAKEVDDMIAAVDLQQKRHSFASQLSGGMKRKLSIGIAYIGGSKLIILDEPTAGMDPVSRQKIWELIQKFKAGRVTLLTTHFLAEADVLGDRIGIVNNGRMRCCGTSLFLKNRFGLGYQINMVRSSSCLLPALEAHITSHVPSAQLLSQSGLELSYRLPFSSVLAFPSLLRSLDSQSRELGVQSYGLGVTTLEEVFLSVTKESSEFKQPTGNETEMQHVKSDANFCENPTVTSPSSSSSKTEIGEVGTTHPSSASDVSIDSFTASVYDHVAVLLTKRSIQSLRSPRSLFCNMAFPIILAIIGGLLTKAPIAALNQPPLYLDPSIVLKPSSFVLVNTAALADINPASVPCTPSPSPPLTLAIPSQSGVSVSVIGSGVNTLQQQLYTNSLRDGQDFDLISPFSLTFMCNGSKQGILLWNNRKVQHALPTALSILHSSIQPFPSYPAVQFHVNNWPIEYKISRPANNVAGYIIVLMVAMSFAPGFPAYVAVQERVTKSRHLLRVMGMRPYVYWCTYYAFDLVWQYTFVIASIVVAIGMEIDGLTDGPFHALCLLLSLATTNNIVLMYILSFFVDDPVMMQLVAFFFNFVLGFFMGLVFYILLLIGRLQQIQELITISDAVFWLFAWVPAFGFMTGSLRAVTAPQGYLSRIPWANVDLNRVLDKDTGVATNLAWLLACSIVFPIILFVLEAGVVSVPAILQSYYSFRSLVHRFFCKLCCAPPAISSGDDEPASSTASPSSPEQAIDDDVAAEASRIQSHSNQPHDMIELCGLDKRYPAIGPTPAKHALRGLSVGIPVGEVFGLLGPNGAGKTTTIGILTGDMKPTSGSAFVNFSDISSNSREGFKVMGFCPQFDALWPDMTGREHLYVYGRVKGVPPSLIDDVVNAMLKRMALWNYRDKLAGDYSGGNKRKLSVAIALLGDPKVLYLDEPSTGMDAHSRRFMWDLISQQSKNRAVIITTHAMEEAEALCSRIGIMIQGKLRCVGSNQHLKSKFGKGYVIQLKVPIEKEELAISFVQGLVPSAVVTQRHMGALSFNAEQLQLSDFFEKIEAAKATLALTDYSISQTTLEQVFISFVNEA